MGKEEKEMKERGKEGQERGYMKNSFAPVG